MCIRDSVRANLLEGSRRGGSIVHTDAVGLQQPGHRGIGLSQRLHVPDHLGESGDCQAVQGVNPVEQLEHGLSDPAVKTFHLGEELFEAIQQRTKLG